MKNFIISRNMRSLFIALGIVLFISCEENIHDFAKKTDADAAHALYIADTNFSFSVAMGVNGENLGVDTIVAKFPIHLSQAAESDITAVVDYDAELVEVYNALYGKNYNRFPAATFKRDKVTIKKGQTESPDSIVVSYPNNPLNLTNYANYTNGFLLPLKIISCSGSDVKIDYERRLAYLNVNVAPQQNGVFFAVPENSAKITNNPMLDIFNDLSALEFSVYLRNKANSDVKINLSVNNGLIAEYNNQSKTNYQAIPVADFNTLELTIPKGETKVTATVPYKGDISTLRDLNGYVAPLEITSVAGEDMGIVNAQKVFYAFIDISNLYGTLVEDPAELGTKVTDRADYKVVKFVNANTGAEVVPSNGAGTQNNMFTDNNAQFWVVQQSGIKLDITVDLGAEVRNISGLWLEGYQANASFNMKGVDIYYATGTMYSAGQSSLVGKISLSTGRQMWYIKFSEPIDARYIMLNNMIPTGSMLALRQFYICTGN